MTTLQGGSIRDRWRESVWIDGVGSLFLENGAKTNAGRYQKFGYKLTMIEPLCARRNIL